MPDSERLLFCDPLFGSPLNEHNARHRCSVDRRTVTQLSQRHDTVHDISINVLIG